MIRHFVKICELNCFQTTEQRKANLLKGYKFECRCEACTKDYPLLADLNSRLPSKLNKQLESLLSQYQRHFKANEIDEARVACSKYLSKLDQVFRMFQDVLSQPFNSI